MLQWTFSFPRIYWPISHFFNKVTKKISAADFSASHIPSWSKPLVGNLGDPESLKFRSRQEVSEKTSIVPRQSKKKNLFHMRAVHTTVLQWCVLRKCFQCSVVQPNTWHHTALRPIDLNEISLKTFQKSSNSDKVSSQHTPASLSLMWLLVWKGPYWLPSSRQLTFAELIVCNGCLNVSLWKGFFEI